MHHNVLVDGLEPGEFWDLHEFLGGVVDVDVIQEFVVLDAIGVESLQVKFLDTWGFCEVILYYLPIPPELN